MYAGRRTRCALVRFEVGVGRARDPQLTTDKSNCERDLQVYGSKEISGDASTEVANWVYRFCISVSSARFEAEAWQTI